VGAFEILQVKLNYVFLPGTFLSWLRDTTNSLHENPKSNTVKIHLFIIMPESGLFPRGLLRVSAQGLERYKRYLPGDFSISVIHMCLITFNKFY